MTPTLDPVGSKEVLPGLAWSMEEQGWTKCTPSRPLHLMKLVSGPEMKDHHADQNFYPCANTWENIKEAIFVSQDSEVPVPLQLYPLFLGLSEAASWWKSMVEETYSYCHEKEAQMRGRNQPGSGTPFTAYPNGPLPPIHPIFTVPLPPHILAIF